MELRNYNIGVSLALFTACVQYSDELMIKLNAVESICAVHFYNVVDTSRAPLTTPRVRCIGYATKNLRPRLKLSEITRQASYRGNGY